MIAPTRSAPRRLIDLQTDALLGAVVDFLALAAAAAFLLRPIFGGW